MTLIRSYTTRRSQPMIRSRLRRPTSKSRTAVLCPRMARPDAKLALEVVLPTPPLPDVTTITFATKNSFQEMRILRPYDRLHGNDVNPIADKTNLGRMPG